MLPLHPQTTIKDDSVAQLVEQMTLNHWAEGSNPSGVTIEQPNGCSFFLWRDSLGKVNSQTDSGRKASHFLRLFVDFCKQKFESLLLGHSISIGY